MHVYIINYNHTYIEYSYTYSILILISRYSYILCTHPKCFSATCYISTITSSVECSRYLEINVAGFRKLLKRHEKQADFGVNDFRCLHSATFWIVPKL